MKRICDRTNCGVLAVVAVVLGAGLPWGCIEYQAKPLSADQAAAGFEARTLDDPGLTAFLETSQAPPEWDLDRLALAAFYFHPDLDVARAELAVAEAAKVTAGERPNPSLAITPAFNSTDTVRPWMVDVQLDIPIETADKRSKRIAMAECLRQAARLRVAARAWDIRSRVRQALLALQNARESLELLRRQNALHAEVVRLIEAQRAAGSASDYDVSEARVASQQSRLAVRDAEIREAAALAQLAEGISLPSAALADVAFAFEPLDTPTPVPSDADARRRAVTRRADLLAFLAEYAASEADLELEVAKQYPDISLGHGYKLDQTDNEWSLGFAVELPVFNRNEGPIAEALARRDETAARFNALQARVFGEIDAARAACRTTLLKREEAEALRREADQRREAAEARFKAGEVSHLNLVFHEIERNAAALLELNARAEARRALGDMEDALQSTLTLSDAVLKLSPSSDQAAAEKASP